MIFRELNNKLYEITLPRNVTEKQFLNKQKNGTIVFLQVDYKDLPEVDVTEKRRFNKIFYELNLEDIIIDYDRTIKMWIEDKYKQTENYIYDNYSQNKQASDQADKEYYYTILKAEGVNDLEAVISLRIQDFFKDTTLESLVADDINKEAYIQLIKVGIRITWLQSCKQELKLAITENREPNFPQYPL